MRQITINIPENKYSFFLELVKNLGLEKVKDLPSESTGESKEQKAVGNPVTSLRGRLHLSKEQYKDFHLYVNDSRNEWNRGI
jgi:hypothetical protein